MKIQKTRKRQVKKEQVKEFLRELRSANMSFYLNSSNQDQKTSSSTKKNNVTPISSLVENKPEAKVEVKVEASSQNNLTSLLPDQKTLDEFKLFQEYLKMKNSSQQVESIKEVKVEEKRVIEENEVVDEVEEEEVIEEEYDEDLIESIE